MARHRKPSKGKKINPTFFIFCEGKTEEQYIRFLKSQYRIPLVIDSKVKSINISERYIQNYKKGKLSHKKDKTFLLYDLDVKDVLEKLSKFNDTILLLSNPCIELWFLLHLKTQNAEINCKRCNYDLNKNGGGYKKGVLTNHLKDLLMSKQLKAINRSKKLIQYNNPSSTIHLLIEALEEIKKNKS